MNVKTTKNLGKLIALSLITSTALHATNGDTLISVGTKARGMGGVGIAMSHGAESGLSNPALITTVKSSEISFGGTIFMPDIQTQMPGAAKLTSDNDMNVIPSVSLAHKYDENWYLGIGMWGTAGLGVDFRDAPQTQTDSGNLHMVTNLQLMQFGVPIAYKMEGLSLAVSPILQYGSLDINYMNLDGSYVGDGVAQDLKFGFNVGATYNVGNGLTLGAVYKSSIEMDYGNQLSTATAPFAALDMFPGAMEDKLEQPAEIGIGMAYVMGQHTFAFDYKQIQWADAKGYKDFGWDDQDVYAIGYQYTENEWAVRLGYNHASHPLSEAPSGGAVQPSQSMEGSYPNAGGDAINLFNILGFPATAEDHYTLGASYAFSDTFTLDLAYVYAAETKTTMTTIAGVNPMTGDLYTGPSTVWHAEDSISFQLTYNF
jgi:long-chain fatty acid transport protein